MTPGHSLTTGGLVAVSPAARFIPFSSASSAVAYQEPSYAGWDPVSGYNGGADVNFKDTTVSDYGGPVITSEFALPPFTGTPL